MTMRNLFFHILLLVSASGTLADYCYFELELPWIATICKHAPCKASWQSIGAFVIGGLDPSGNLTDYGPTPFAPDKISNITNFLQKYWPQFKDVDPNDTDEELWKQEWEGHGRWSENYFNQLQYFELALKLIGDIKPEDTLADHGIFPDPVKKYNTSSVIEAFQKKPFHSPAPYCDDEGNLQGLTFCLNQRGTEYLRCPNTTPSCPDEIVYPLPELVPRGISLVGRPSMSPGLSFKE